MATSLGSQVISDVGNILASPALHLQTQMAWTDRVDLLSLAADLGPINGSGALAHKVGVWNPTALESAAVAEGIAATLADPTDTTFTITVAKQKAAVGLSDELAIISPTGYGFDELIEQMVVRAAMQAVDLICATFPSFTAGPSAGSTMSVGLFLESYFDFNALRCPSGQGVAVMHTTPYEQLVQSFRSEGSGDLLLRDADTSPGLMVNLMEGYKGTPIRGLHVVETSRVTTASSNYEQAIVGVPMMDGRGRQVGASLYYKWADQSGLERFATAWMQRTALGQGIARLWDQLQAAGKIAPNVPPPPVLLMLTAARVDLTGETALYCQWMFGVAVDAAKGVRLRSAA